MAYDLKRLVFGAIIFTASMYVFLLIVAGLGANYGKSLEGVGGDLFDENKWIIDAEIRYEQASGIKNASETASVVDLDKPSSAKSIFDQVGAFITMPFNLLYNVLGVVFKIPAAILWTMMTLLSIEIVLVIWRILKQGD